MLWLEKRFPGTEIALALSYTANWALAFNPTYHLTWLNHCWSLAVEEQFYMIWPLVILCLGRMVQSPATRTKVLLAGAAAIAVYRATRVGVYSDYRINFGLDTRMDSLMVGAALACFVQSLPGGRLPDAAGKWLGRVVAPLMLVALFAVINTVTWYSPWMGWIGYVLVGGAATLVVLDLVAGGHSWLAPVLAARPMVYVGRISYGVYLYHLPVYYAVEKLMPDAALPVRLGVKLVVTFALAIPSFYLVEQRFLRLKGRFESGGAKKTEKLKN
jgi:peptidoglycan/LPS O-acetylase OafA/YrhL